MLRRASRAYACRSCPTLDGVNTMGSMRQAHKLLAALRQAACPSAVGARIVLGSRACASAALGCPSVGGQRSGVQVSSKGNAALRRAVRPAAASAAACKLAAEQHQYQSATCAAQAQAQRLRSQRRRCRAAFAAVRVRSCYGFALACGARRFAARVGGGVRSSASASRAQGSAVLLCQQRANTIEQGAPSNPSIERTSKRLRLFAAAHVER